MIPSRTTQQFTLENGLRVILRESHISPVISTWIWYRAGSRNETTGLTGLAHFVEHMLFKGTPRFPQGQIMRLVSQRGGYTNAFTSQDFTAYYTTLASEHWYLALDFEADRMVNALFAPEDVEIERTVILAEREAKENDPLSLLFEEMTAAAFRQHPYRHQTIGWKSDLVRITREDLYDYYRRYYAPNNAILVMVGDFDTLACLERIRERFGDIPPSPMPAVNVPTEPPQRGERRVMLRMPGAASSVHIAYHAPAAAHPDFVPLLVLDALLTGGKAIFSFSHSQARSARLYRALVETGLASSVSSNYPPTLDPFFFSVDATVRLGVRPEEVETALLREIARLQENPPEEAELVVAARQAQAQLAYSTESVTSQALALGYLEIIDRHDRLESLFQELAQVTPDDVTRVARTYLIPEECTVGWFVPTGTAPEGDAGHAFRRWATQREFEAYGGHYGILGPQTIVRATFDNGLTVLVQERPSSQAITVAGQLQAGSYLDTPETQGLTALTAAMLRRGTERHSFQEINIALDNLGASFNFLGGREKISFGGRSLSADWSTLIDLMAEMLTCPTFPEIQIERLRGQLLTRIAELEMEAGYRANQAFVEELYGPDHPYRLRVMGTRETLCALNQKDLLHHYNEYFGPNGAVIAVVGAVPATSVIERLYTLLGGWRRQNVIQVPSIPLDALPPFALRRNVDIPGRPQIELVMGVLGMPGYTEEYYAALVANAILSDLGMLGRLGETLREKRGLVYHVNSDLYTGRIRRPWMISAGVSSEKLEEAIRAIEEELTLMREEPVKEQELIDAQAFLTGSLPLLLETNEGIASLLLTIETYQLGFDYLERYPSLIRRVTAESIQGVMQKYWPAGRYVMAVAGTLA